MNRQSIIIYTLVFISSLTVLFLYLIKADIPFMNITPDGLLYYNMAENLLKGNGLINQIRVEEIIVPPLFAVILAPFALLFDTETPFFIFQYVLYGLNAVLTSFIAKKFFNSYSAAVVVGLFYGIQPVLFRNGPQFLLTETIFITLTLISVLLLKKWIDLDGDTKTAGWLITFISITLLFRPHLIFMFVLIGMLVIFFAIKNKKTLIIILFAVIPLALLYLNGIYNKNLHGEFVTLENYSGQNMYIANNPESKVAFYATTIQEQFVEPYYYTLADKSLSEKSSILKKRVLGYMIDRPVEVVERTVKKMILFFKPLDKVDLVSIVLSLTGLITAIVFDKKRRVLHFSMLIYMIGFTSLTSLGLLIGGQRYRAPLAPVYLLYIGYLVVSVKSLFIHHKK
jgi:hypothetical protein